MTGAGPDITVHVALYHDKVRAWYVAVDFVTKHARNLSTDRLVMPLGIHEAKTGGDEDSLIFDMEPRGDISSPGLRRESGKLRDENTRWVVRAGIDKAKKPSAGCLIATTLG